MHQNAASSLTATWAGTSDLLWPAMHPATFPNSADGFCMCRSSLQIDSPHFNERCHLLKGRKKFLNLSFLIRHQLTAVVTATAISSSVPCHTHTFFFFFFTQISYHTSFTFPELKPHPNSLHSLTYKLRALQPRFNLRLSPAIGSACQDLHSFKHQWNTVSGCNTLVCTFAVNCKSVPTCGSHTAESHHLERGCSYHRWGLKLGEGHGRPGVQSLL